MGYTNKTTKFQLPQFIKTDKPQMADFNDAFKNIDNKAVSKSGDTMTGTSLGLNNGLARLASTSNLLQLSAYKEAGKSPHASHLQIYNAADGVLKGLVNLAVYDADGSRKNYNLYGEHNKPTVTYTGNGSTALRNIEIGGVGSVVAISSSRGCAIVNPINGLCYSSSGGIEVLNSTKIKLQEGNLILATDNEKVNANGVTYTCILL